MLKLFSHRGYLPFNNQKNLLQENSIASLKNAVNHGFKAIEFDIWYIENQLILSHDMPTNTENCARFIEYLQYQNQLEYWLDFKNLTTKNFDNVLELVIEDLMTKRINLAQLYFAPYCTDYRQAKIFCKKINKYFHGTIEFVAVCDDIKQIDDLEKLVLEQQIKFISIDHKLISQELLERFKQCQLMAWTIKDQDTLIKLSELGIKHFACDILPHLDSQ